MGFIIFWSYNGFNYNSYIIWNFRRLSNSIYIRKKELITIVIETKTLKKILDLAKQNKKGKLKNLIIIEK